ncbi:MAG: hypothetical protein ACRETG_10985, partial [Steroidobacteraceae bacterium]
LFGGKVLARKSIENKIWFASGAMLQALGWEQDFQGLKYRDHRPDGAYLDDIENRERVRGASAVQEGMKKLYHELIPALDKKRRRIRFSEVRRAQDCMLTRLSREKKWLYRAFPVCDRDPDDPQAVSLWPERYPMTWVRNEKDTFQSAGMLSEFMQEYMLQAVDFTTKPFKPEQLAELELSPYHWMPRYAIYDPSRSTRTRRTLTEVKSDRTGKVVVSRLGSKIMVHESGGHYWQPSELVGDLFATLDAHHPVKIGIEQNSLNEWLAQPIRLEIMRRATPLPLTLLKAPQDRSKEDFILGLQPFAEARDIVLVGGHAAHPELVAEWTNFPIGSRDVMNALAYSLRMFGGIPMYEDFGAANLTDGPDPTTVENLFVGFAANAAEVAAVAVVKEGRRLVVVADWQLSGVLAEAVCTLIFDLRTRFPRARLQAWLPAEVHDQWQRVPLLPALRQEKLTPLRAEHEAVARGCLSDRLRTTWRQQRLLTVDRKAHGTLNALASGYCLPPDREGGTASEPEAGPARLLAEALECMVMALDRREEQSSGFPTGAHLDRSPSGATYVSANPRHLLTH